MATSTLKNMMVWHRMARKFEEDGQWKSLPCRDVPVMAIIKAFHELAGQSGRQRHRSFPVPSYEYEKGRTPAAKEAMARALTSQVPVIQEETAPKNMELPEPLAGNNPSSGTDAASGGMGGGVSVGAGAPSGGGAGSSPLDPASGSSGGAGASGGGDIPEGGDQVDHACVSGAFARFGEMPTRRLGPDAGVQLGTHRVISD